MTFKSFENSGSLTALKSWFAEQNRDAYGIGPLLPLGYGVKDISSSRGDNKVELFLEDMLKQNGEDSVLFVSFFVFFMGLVFDSEANDCSSRLVLCFGHLTRATSKK